MKANELISTIIDKINKVEEDFVVGVLKEFLNRQPTPEDFIKCTRTFPANDTTWYYLSYDGKTLGVIRRNFTHDPVNFSVTFDPELRPVKLGRYPHDMFILPISTFANE